MKKLSDEELSRVLWAHDVGLLIRVGRKILCHETIFTACPLQIAYNEPEPDKAFELNPELGKWCDSNYLSSWTVEELLEQLKERGAA